MSKQQYITRHDNEDRLTQRANNEYPALFGQIAVRKKSQSLSQVEALQAQIVDYFADAGLSVGTTYVHYRQQWLCVGIKTQGPGFYTDAATAAVRQVRYQLQRAIGRQCSIAVEEYQGTVWLETEE